MTGQRVIVFGSRTWSDSHQIYADLHDLRDLGYHTLVHGACPSGADFLADIHGRALGFAIERHRAQWDEHGRTAGPARNEHMASLGADVAFGYRMGGESRGTDHMARACERHGIALVRRGRWT